MIDKDNENWVQIAEFNEDSEIVFTDEYLKLTKGLGGNSRKLASHLISHWDTSFSNMLDYFGPDDANKDWYTGVDGDPMDVREDTAEMWEYNDIPIEGLTADWYRDIMRCKLVTLKIPERLINSFITTVSKRKEGL